MRAGRRPASHVQLAAMLGVEKAALTGLADRAERRGLIARAAVPGDRRALSVALTPTGLGAATAFHRELSAELARLSERAPAGRVHSLQREPRPHHGGRSLAGTAEPRLDFLR